LIGVISGMWIIYSILAVLSGILSFVLALNGKENKYTVTVSIATTMLIILDFYKSCANAVIMHNSGYLEDVVPDSVELVETVLVISILFNLCCLLLKDYINKTNAI